ncbi:MAG: hypothetical protein P9M06_02245 [Candidatus Saelkia tenebricola]|nr:hypothetical protein [Candidatus Saelkia tenebricola]
MKKKDSKTLEMTVRFFIDNMSVESPIGKKRIVCWDCGMAYTKANKSVGIKSVSGQPFQCLEDIVPLIKEILRKQNVLMVSANRRPRIMNPQRRSK